MSVNDESTDREIVFERIYDAPRALVWRAYTEVEHLVHWWGPDGFTTTYHEMDVRPGGIAKFLLHGPDGTDYPNTFWFREVIKPERLVFDHGDFVRPWFKVTVTFEEHARGTRLTARMVFPTVEACAAVKARGAVELGKQTYEHLANYLREMT